MAKESENMGHIEASEAPEGFNIKVGRNKGDGWVRKFKGCTVQGILLGCYTMRKANSDGKPRKYFQVELTRPIEAVQVLGEDDEGYDEEAEDGNRVDVRLEPGKILNVDMSVGLKDLEPYFVDGNRYELHFSYMGQDKKYRNMWRVNGPYLKPLK